MTARPVAPALIAATLIATPAAAEPLRHEPHCQRGLFCLSAERSGDRVTPRFNGEAFYDKPILFT